MERPDVDKITGLSPVISIEQKTTNKNPRSTVGTTTEIYDFLRLLYARTAEAYSYVSGEKMVRYTEEQILELQIENEELKDKYTHLKMAKYIDLTDDEKRQSRSRINKMVRDVEKCIAILKVESH